jgi:hypothetical protein
MRLSRRSQGHALGAHDPVVGALGPLLFVSNRFPDFQLNFAIEVFRSAFDLISIHGDFTQIVNELL